MAPPKDNDQCGQASAPDKADGLPRRRIAKGPARPAYLDSADMDKLGIMFVALISEVLAIKDRVDTHEVLLERDGKLTAGAIEAFRPDAEREAMREQKRLAVMRRVFRVLQDELEAVDVEFQASGSAER